jgi:hypothetical protein
MKKNSMMAVILGAVAAVLFFASAASYVFPGVSAHLQSLWLGLDVAESAPYPLMAQFAGMFGAGNAMSPVFGALAVFLLFVFTSAFVSLRVHGEE